MFSSRRPGTWTVGVAKSLKKKTTVNTGGSFRPEEQNDPNTRREDSRPVNGPSYLGNRVGLYYGNLSPFVSFH